MSSLLEIWRGRGGEGGITSLNDAFESRLEAMVAALPPNLRGQLTILSGYRSVDHQQELWDRAVKRYGSPEAARKWVAPPGKSNHNRGMAVDLTFGSPAVQTWVHQNAARFGLAFPMDHEPWHVEPAGWRDGSSPTLLQGHDHGPDPEAYTDGQGIPEVNNMSLETQLLRVVDILAGNAYGASNQLAAADPSRLAATNISGENVATVKSANPLGGKR